MPCLHPGGPNVVDSLRSHGTVTTTRVFSWAILATTLASLTVAMVSGVAMLGHLRGGNRELLKAVMLGPFCPRETFTDAGWRYRNRALWAAGIAFASFVAWTVVYLRNR